MTFLIYIYIYIILYRLDTKSLPAFVRWEQEKKESWSLHLMAHYYNTFSEVSEYML